MLTVKIILQLKPETNNMKLFDGDKNDFGGSLEDPELHDEILLVRQWMKG